MGRRFRKWVKRGGGSKVHLRKSNLGRSRQSNGARIRKTFKGSNRTTLQVPGAVIPQESETAGNEMAKNHSAETQTASLHQPTSHVYIFPLDLDGNAVEMKRSKKPVKKVVLWLLTVCFVVLFLACLPHISGFIALAAAVLLVPAQKWQALLGKYIDGKTKAFAVIGLATLFFVTMPSANTDGSDIPVKAVIVSSSEATQASEETLAKTEAVTESSTEAVTESVTELTAESTAESTEDTEASEAVYEGLTVISWPKTISRNETGTVEIQGKPNTTYTIQVYYKSGASTADGLEAKTSDNNGYVFWTWKVGGRTSAGTFRIVISGGGESKTVYFTVEAE